MSYERFVPSRRVSVLDEAAKVTVGNRPYMDKRRGHRSASGFRDARITPDRDNTIVVCDKLVRHGGASDRHSIR